MSSRQPVDLQESGDIIDEPSGSPAPAPDNAESIARSMGWKPLEEFRGDAEKWVPAAEFIERGEHFLPILRKDNKALRESNEALRRQQAEMQQALTEAREAIEALKEYQTTAAKKDVEAARVDLVARLVEAREKGDVAAEAELLDELAEIRAAQKAAGAPAPAAPAPAPAPATPAADPVFTQWVADNPWFETDVRKRSLAIGIAQEMRADPANKSLVGREFFDKVAAEVEATFSPPTRPAASRVGAAGTRAAGGGAPAAGRGYASLPADAKAACDSLASRLVGPNKAFKDLNTWREKYAEDYRNQ